MLDKLCTVQIMQLDRASCYEPAQGFLGVQRELGTHQGLDCTSTVTHCRRAGLDRQRNSSAKWVWCSQEMETSSLFQDWMLFSTPWQRSRWWVHWVYLSNLLLLGKLLAFLEPRFGLSHLRCLGLWQSNTIHISFYLIGQNVSLWDCGKVSFWDRVLKREGLGLI